MRVGTNRFFNFSAAIRYYRNTGLDDGAACIAVVQKIRDNEIDFGPPAIKDGERYILIDDNTRYAVEIDDQPTGD